MGGGGGLHAASLAKELGVRKVIVPRAPGHFSAWGMLMTDLRHDYIMTKVLPWSPQAIPEFKSAFESMEKEAYSQLAAERVPAGQVALFRFVDMRYEGQEHTVKVPVPVAQLGEAEAREVERRFHELHKFRFTFRLDDPTEAVNFHLMALGRLRKPVLRALDPGDRDLRQAFKGTRAVDFDEHGILETRIYEREKLAPGIRLPGPAIVEEPASTTVVHPGQGLRVDAFGNLVITPEGAP